MKIQSVNDMKPPETNKRLNQPDPTLPLPDTYIGIELELENVDRHDITDFNNVYWEITQENSLRNNGFNSIGIEFKYKEPTFGKDISKSLDELKGIFKRSRPDCSVRTSTHVHFDVRHLDVKDVQNILYVYFIFERILFKYEGTGRDNNMYCVPAWKFAYEYADEIAAADMARSKAHKLFEKFRKYGAINLNSIMKYGSIEFRLMHGLYEKEPILEWVKILMSIIDYALSVDEVDSLPIQISADGTLPFLHKVFHHELVEALLYDSIDRDLYEGIRSAQDFIYYNQAMSVVDDELVEEGSDDSPLKDDFLKAHGFAVDYVDGVELVYEDDLDEQEEEDEEIGIMRINVRPDLRPVVDQLFDQQDHDEEDMELV